MFEKILIAFIGAVSLLTAAEERCLNDFTIGFLYKELGCKPVHEEASKCPSHFDCSNYSARKTNVCNYKGRAYPIGSEVSTIKDNPCVASCRCIEDGHTGLATFTCANVECFDWHLENENCTRLYSDESCCSVKTHCIDDDPVPTCLVDGNVYKEGQKFYPKDEPCKVCICKEGFSGKYEEPYCQDVTCGVELHYTSRMTEECVPVYFGRKGCCPIDWKCPDAKADEVVPFRGKAARTTSEKCKFGKLEFQQHDELKTNDPSLECKCSIPPFLTCTNIPQ